MYRYAYYRMMEDVDAQIGQVLDAMQKAGAEDNTPDRLHQRPRRRARLTPLDRQDDVL